MASLLSTTNNTRPILPDSLRFLRSDVPIQATEEEMRWLLAQNVRTVIDLRSPEECRRRPCPLERHTGFRYLHLPVTGGNAVPETPEQVALSYFAMVDDQMEHILQTCLEAGSNVLYFCAAGKDRTGVVSALLLRRLGFGQAYIVEDYLLSAENLKEELAAYTSQHPEIDPAVITPQRQYMEGFLDLLDE